MLGHGAIGEYAIGGIESHKPDQEKEPHCELALWQKVADCAHEACRRERRCVAADDR
jgi:hypothetical protein